MDPVLLESGSYTGSYKLVGGQLSLDLVNTVSWPGTEREHDWFDPPKNVTRWAVAVGILDDTQRHRLDDRMDANPVEAAHELAAIVRIRRALRSAIAPLAHGRSPTRRAIHELNHFVARTCARRQIDPTTLAWTWKEPGSLADAMAPVIHNAADVVAGIDPRRLGHCPSCDWLFHDTTRNMSRRWCDMADCGSRDKALRYYHRHKPPA